MNKLDYNEDDIQAVVDMTGLKPDKAEKLILDVYKDMEDDSLCIFDILDVIESEKKVKDNNIKNVVTKVKPKDTTEKKKRTVNTPAEKIELYNTILNNLKENYGEKVKIVTENKLITCEINGILFKIDIIKTKKK